MESITDIHDLIITGGGGPVVEVASVARLHGLHPLVVPAVPARVDLLHRPLRVWDGDRELRARAIVIAHEHGPLPEVYRDWLAHDRHGRLVTEGGTLGAVQITPLRIPGRPSSVGRNLGTRNKLMPLLPAGASGRRASTR